MTESPSQTQPEHPSTEVKQQTVNWPLWIGIGGFSGAAIALVIALAGLIGQNPAPPVGAQPPIDNTFDSPGENTPEENTPTPPTDLREHQQLVSEVINDLERDFLIGESPTRGNPDADIVMFEFSDFQCPYCAQVTEEVEAFLETHESEVLFVYKHLPLIGIHSEAMSAALASWAAEQQGQFWPFHDALFANQERLGEALYVEIAQELELDIGQFNRDRASEAAKAAIARDLALASEMQLTSTPMFIMSDLLIPGAVPADFFADLLMRLQAFQEETDDSQ
ncbi:MAG: thioredoxin domain-containing protein [Cyanobacteria bacterium P01_F01_bin.86]